MKADPALVSLREITADTVVAITRLAVADDQKGFVAPNAVSLAQALFTPEAWYRAIYLGDTPVGFVMLEDESLQLPPPEQPEIGVWRFMIDARHQARASAGSAAVRHRAGTGPQALREARALLRSRPGCPEPFYLGSAFATPAGRRQRGRARIPVRRVHVVIRNRRLRPLRRMRTLETEGLVLEPLTAAHAEAMFELLSDPELFRYLDDSPRPTSAS